MKKEDSLLKQFESKKVSLKGVRGGSFEETDCTACTQSSHGSDDQHCSDLRLDNGTVIISA